MDVNADDYVGRPVDDVVAELEGLGLKTKTKEQENLGTEEAGAVDSLDPTGTVEKGTHGSPSPTGATRWSRTPGGRRDKPSKGNGNGNGKGNEG